MVPLNVTLSGATVVGFWAAIAAMIGVFLKQIVPFRKQSSDAEARLRDTLIRRIEKLEEKIDRQEARHEAERSLSNHKFKNVTACFDAMLMMLKMNPDRAPEIVVEIEAMRERQMKAEAEEAAIIRRGSFTDTQETGE